MRNLFIFLIPLLLLACKDKDPTVTLKLTDRAGELEAMNLQIQGAEVKINDQWQLLNVIPATYNVVNYVNGRDTVIVSQKVPQGELTAVKLTLGTANSAEIRDSTFQIFLVNPSASSPEVELEVSQTITEGSSISIILDFDVASSIYIDSRGIYNLNPVFRAFSEGGETTIYGQAAPPDARPVIYAIATNDSGLADTVTSTFTDPNGFYKLRGLEAGKYRITFEPTQGYDEAVVDGVELSEGESRMLDDVEITLDN